MASADRQGPSQGSWMSLLWGARYWDGIAEQARQLIAVRPRKWEGYGQ
jgi:hypothetical protein